MTSAGIACHGLTACNRVWRHHERLGVPLPAATIAPNPDLRGNRRRLRRPRRDDDYLVLHIAPPGRTEARTVLWRTSEAPGCPAAASTWRESRAPDRLRFPRSSGRCSSRCAFPGLSRCNHAARLRIRRRSSRSCPGWTVCRRGHVHPARLVRYLARIVVNTSTPPPSHCEPVACTPYVLPFSRCGRGRSCWLRASCRTSWARHPSAVAVRECHEIVAAAGVAGWAGSTRQKWPRSRLSC
jgi:hypothetical protein